MKNNIEKLFSYINDRNFQKRLKTINIGIALIAILYIVTIVYTSEESLNILLSINLVEVILLGFIYFIVGVTWVNFSTDSVFTEKKNIFFDWSYSNIGKYFPGGVGLISIRLNQDTDKSNAKKILFGLFEEQFLIPFLSLPVLFFSSFFLKSNYFYIFIISFQIAFVYLFKRGYFINKKIKNISLLNFSNYLIITILLTNFLTFFIFYNLGYENYLNLGIYYLIASYAGLLFIGIPAGFGIREGIFLFLLGANFTVSQDLSALLYFRILYLIIDVFYGFLGFIYKTKN
tara:strand:- start:1365 stop:2228 length:864 start_codon:yes stop_codon:yes gene_type:complete